MAEKSSPIRLIILIAVVAALIGLGWYFDAQTYLRSILEWIRDRGFAGVVVFAAVYIVAAVLFLAPFSPWAPDLCTACCTGRSTSP